MMIAYKKWILGLIAVVGAVIIGMASNQALNGPKYFSGASPKDSSFVEKGQNNPASSIAKQILPNQELPVRIAVSFLLNGVYKIDEKADNFEASIDLQLHWKDSSLAFDPKKEGTFRKETCFEDAQEQLTKMWNPLVVISNISGKPLKNDICLIINADGDVSLIQRIRAVFDSKFHLESFPFDKQSLDINIVSTRFNTDQIELVVDEYGLFRSGFREGISFTGWTFEKMDFIETTTRGLDGRYFPGLKLDILIARKASAHLFAFAPLLLIVVVPTILTLFSFKLYSKIEVPILLGTWSSAILALIALSFSLNLRYPALGSESLLGKLIALIFGYEFLMICFTVTIFNPKLLERVNHPRLTSEIIRFLRWGVPLAFLILLGVILLLTMLSSNSYLD